MSIRTRAALVCVALLVGGCSSGDPSGSDGPATTSASRSATPGRPAECWTASRPEGTGVALEDATSGSGLIEPLTGMFGHATAAADVNADGWTDLFVGTFADKSDDRYKERGAEGPAPDRLLLGGPDGFRTGQSFEADGGRTSAAVFADFDGDASLDLLVVRNSELKPGREVPSHLYRNDSGQLRRVGKPMRLEGGRAPVVLDYDDDGRLDVLVVADPLSDGKNVLLHNDGEFAFTETTAKAGIDEKAYGLGAAAADLNGDRRPDVVIGGSRKVFVNAGDGRFDEVDVPDLQWETYGSEDMVAGVAVGDLDRDGRPDLVVGHHFNSTEKGRTVPIRVLLNSTEGGRLAFSDVTKEAGLPALSARAPHVEIVDFDNDGWPDILATVASNGGKQPAVFANQGVEDGAPRFDSVPGLGSSQYWVSGVVFDADHDGRQDVFVVEFDPAKPSRLFRGAGGGGHWIDVGVDPSAAGAVGALVEVYRAGQAPSGAALLSRQEVVAARGNGAGGPPEVHVGLGDIDKVDVIVTPRTGDPVRLDDLEADQRIEVFGGC